MRNCDRPAVLTPRIAVAFGMVCVAMLLSLFVAPVIVSAAAAAGLVTMSSQPAFTSQPTVRSLLTAARRGDVAELTRAISAGVNVNGRDPRFRQTALIRAAMFAQPDALGLLLDAGADPSLAAAPEGIAAMHWAVIHPRTDLVQLLVRAGVSANATDQLGRTPLDHALVAGSVDATRALLAAGAAPEQMATPISGRIGRALSPTAPGQLDALLVVIATGRGLEVDAGFTNESTALLALASIAGRPNAERVAAALIAAGANVRATDHKGRTAREIVEPRIPAQSDPRVRRTLEAVVDVLRRAEAGA
jgi:ankyrin repeat protein